MSVTTPERVAQALSLAADKLEVGWTTGAAARGVSGVEMAPTDALACSWCSIGAIWAVAGREASEGARGAYSDYLARRFHVRGIATWNDHHCPDQATAVATMREAAKHVRAEAGR